MIRFEVTSSDLSPAAVNTSANELKAMHNHAGFCVTPLRLSINNKLSGSRQWQTTAVIGMVRAECRRHGLREDRRHPQVPSGIRVYSVADRILRVQTANVSSVLSQRHVNEIRASGLEQARDSRVEPIGKLVSRRG